MTKRTPDNFFIDSSPGNRKIGSLRALIEAKRNKEKKNLVFLLKMRSKFSLNL